MSEHVWFKEVKDANALAKKWEQQVEEQWLDELREYCVSWLTSRENNPNSPYHAGAAKVADRVLARLRNHSYGL